MDARTDEPVIGSRGSFVPLVAALLAAIFLFGPGAAVAAPPADEFWTFPEDCAAFFAFDPKPLGAGIDKDPTRALVEAGLRSLLQNIGTIDGGGCPIPDAVLRPSVLGGAPYRVCLMELAGEPASGPIGPDRPLKIERLSAIIEVRAPLEGHEAIIGALRGGLDRDSTARRSAPGTETPLALSGGRRATVFTHEGDPEWREVAWCSTSTALLIGIGHGSLEKWLGAPGPKAGALPEWYAHRADVAKRRASTMPVLECLIDLNALRRGVPEEFAYARIGRLAEAWQVRNARELMLHVRVPRPPAVKAGEAAPAATVAPLLMVDVSYSSRAEKPPACHSLPISEGAWPAGLDAVPATSPYAMVLKSDWARWVDVALDTWIACSARGGLEATAARARWTRAHGPALERAVARAGPWAVIGGSAPVSITLGEAPAHDRLDADLREVFAPFQGEIKFEAGPRVWTFRPPPQDTDPLLAQFAWCLPKDAKTIRGAWDPARLADKKPAR